MLQPCDFTVGAFLLDTRQDDDAAVRTLRVDDWFRTDTVHVQHEQIETTSALGGDRDISSLGPRFGSCPVCVRGEPDIQPGVSRARMVIV